MMENKQTAIQQMIDFINNINDNDSSEFNYYYDPIIGKLNELLEVEKQQMGGAPELRYKDGTPIRKYNSPKVQELEQINQDNPMTRGSTALVKVTSSQTEILAEESWEGCDSCTEQDEIMYKNGYVKGYNTATAELPKEILEEAAENYGWKVKTNTFSDAVKANELAESAKQDFIAGAIWYREQLKKK